MRRIFFGSNGLRAGWCLLIFIAIVAFEEIILGFALLRLIPHFSTTLNGQLTPFIAVTEAQIVLPVLLAAFIMSKIERRPFQSYGLPSPIASGSLIWRGLLLGFAAISALLLVALVLGDFHLMGFAIAGTQIVVAVIAWTIAFAIVGFAEECTFRGYLQYTLARGIGFWPAAGVLSCLFGAAHLHNAGETPMGIACVVVSGLVLCFVLQRTGNLWFGIGFHAAWDWGQTFFYGVRDSGTLPWHPLLQSSLSGPTLISGGTAGPEGGLLGSLAFIIAALVVARVYPGGLRRGEIGI